MIEIKRNKKNIILIHNTTKDAKNHFFLEVFLISILAIAIFVIEKINLYKIVFISFLILGILGLFDLMYALEKTEMHFEEEEIIILRRKIFRKKKQKVLTLNYNDIKKIEKYSPITSKGGPYLNIITFSGENYNVYPTISKEDIDQIIKFYSKFKCEREEKNN